MTARQRNRVLPIWPAQRSADEISLDWRDRGRCSEADPEAWFPEKGGSTRQAKQICRGCEVQTECLEFALGNDERFGVWGGMSEKERRKLKRQREAA